MSKSKKHLWGCLCVAVAVLGFLGILAGNMFYADAAELLESESIGETLESETIESKVATDEISETKSEAESEAVNDLVRAVPVGKIVKHLHNDWIIQDDPDGFSGVPESRLELNGKTVFCVEPRLWVGKGDYYQVDQSVQDYLGISAEKAEQLSLIAFFGITGEDRTNEDWYAITQSMIWNALGEPHWIKTPMTPTKDDLKQCWSQIQADIDTYLQTPSFSENMPLVKAGETVILTDDAGVLGQMKVIDDQGLNVEIKGNQLSIQVPETVSGTKTIRLRKILPEGKRGTSILYGDGADGQKVAEFYVEKTVDFKVSIKVLNQIRYEIEKKTEELSQCLPGAVLRITDKDGKIVDEWTTSDTSHKIQKLKVGETYTLTEVKPAPGYATAPPITFTVKDTSEIQNIVMEDESTKIDISKIDLTNGKELPGASMKVTDKDGKVVDEWVSTDQPHRISKLIVGETYTLIEVVPASGYVTAENVEFTIRDTGEVQKVEMKDAVTTIEIFKVDAESGEAVDGAKLALKDEHNQLVAEWVTTNVPYRLEKLTAGKSYILTEISAPKGYEKAEDVEFFVEDCADTQKVLMKDMKKRIKTEGVKTGDHFNIWLPVMLLIVAVIGGGITVFIKKRCSR